MDIRVRTEPPIDPAVALERMAGDRRAGSDVWVFGYASLIWRPEFDSVEQRPATVYGWHRALRLRSLNHRGTPDCPGLVFALVPGGSCRGMAYRLDATRARGELERLWAREMHNSAYHPRWLPSRTDRGTVHALGFTLSRSSPGYVGPMSDDALIEVFRQARGCYGSTLHYLTETAASLERFGILDREVQRLVELARRHALV